MSVSKGRVLVAVRPAMDPGEPRRLVLEATATVDDALAAARRPGSADDARLIAALDEELSLSQYQVWQVLSTGVERPVTRAQQLSAIAEPRDLRDEDGQPVPAQWASLLVQGYLPVG